MTKKHPFITFFEKIHSFSAIIEDDGGNVKWNGWNSGLRVTYVKRDT